MLLPDKDTIASRVLAKFKGGVESTPTSETDQENVPPETDLKSEGLNAACEDIMQAFKTNSPSDLASALRAFMDQYEATDTQDEG